MLLLLSLRDCFAIAAQVCGNPAIDIDALKRHTVYNKLSASADVVVWLFRALHSFSAEERQLFLRFVYGKHDAPCITSAPDELLRR